METTQLTMEEVYTKTETNLQYVDNKNPLVRLYMKHAQTSVQLRLLKNDNLILKRNIRVKELLLLWK